MRLSDLSQQVAATATALRSAPLTGTDRDLVMFAALALDDVSRVLVAHQADEHQPQHDEQLDIDDVIELTAAAHRPARTADLPDEEATTCP